MPIHVFFDPERVEQLTSCGITARAEQSPSLSRGFVLAGSGPRARGGRAVTHVINTHGSVTITGQRRLLLVERPAATSSAAIPEPRTALELVEECERLRRDNQRLSDEVTRLRTEVDRLTAGPKTPRQHDAPELDDAVQRFSLLELE